MFATLNPPQHRLAFADRLIIDKPLGALRGLELDLLAFGGLGRIEKELIVGKRGDNMKPPKALFANQAFVHG